MQARRPAAELPALQTQPSHSKFTLRGLLTLPYRLCNPPPAVCKVRSFGLTPIFQVELDDVLNRKHLPPLGLKDFEEWLLFVEQCPENLYFILWLREYTQKYNAWAAKVRAREEKERAKDARRARARTRSRRREKSRPTASASTTTTKSRPTKPIPKTKTKSRRGRSREVRVDEALQEEDENENENENENEVGAGAAEGEREAVDDEEEPETHLDFSDDEHTHARSRGAYRVTWTARAEYSPSLALFFTRARDTFFAPGSAYELIVPPELLSPFFVGSAFSCAPSSYPSSCAGPNANANVNAAYLHPHSYPYYSPSPSHSPSPSPTHPHPTGGLPYPLPHPDPALFGPLASHIESRLRLSLHRFVRAAYTNVGTFRASCGIVAGCVALSAGCVPPLVLAFAQHRSRWQRLLALPAMWVGLTLILASLRGICLMVYVFGDFRQLRRFELERPPPPPPQGQQGQKKMEEAMREKMGVGMGVGAIVPPPPAYTGTGAQGRLSSFVRPNTTNTGTDLTNTALSSNLSASSHSHSHSHSHRPDYPGAALPVNAGVGVVKITVPTPIQVRALTAPPKISIRIPPARGHRVGSGAHMTRISGSVMSTSRSVSAFTSTSTSMSTGSVGELTLKSDYGHGYGFDGCHGHSHSQQAISISSERKDGLPLGCSDLAGGPSDSEDRRARSSGRRAQGRLRGTNDLHTGGYSDSGLSSSHAYSSSTDSSNSDSEEDSEGDEDDNGIYISPQMPPPEEAAENDPAVFSAALALVAKARAEAASANANVNANVNGRDATAAASGEDGDGEGMGLVLREGEESAGVLSSATVIGSGSGTGSPAPNVNGSSGADANPDKNVIPNPTASFIPAFPYSEFPYPHQGTEEMDRWADMSAVKTKRDSNAARPRPVSAKSSRSTRSARGAGEMALASPTAGHGGPCWSVKKREKERAREEDAVRRERKEKSRDEKRGGGRDLEKGCEEESGLESSEESEEGGQGSGDERHRRRHRYGRKQKQRQRRLQVDLPELPMGPFDFDALPPVVRAPPPSLSLTPAPLLRADANAHGGTADLEKGLGSAGADVYNGHGQGVGYPYAHIHALNQARSSPFGSSPAAAAATHATVIGTERSRVGANDSDSIQPPSTLSALFAILPLPRFLQRRRSCHHSFSASSYAPTHPFPSNGDPYPAHTHASCPASPSSTLASASPYSSSSSYYHYADGSKGWRRAYASAQRTPAFGPVTRVLSPVVTRAQWEIVVRAFVVAGLVSCVVEAALVALPGDW